MSVEAVASLSSDQARADAASLRLAAALPLEDAGPGATPGDIERGHAAVAAARVDLAQADAAVSADQGAAAPASPPQVASGSDHGVAQVPGHVVEVVV